MNGKYELDKETYMNMSVEEQNWIMFKTYNSDRVDSEEHRKHCDDRFCKLEQRKKTDTAIASGSGILAAIGAMFTKWITFG